MEFHKNNMRPADGRTTVVTGASLNEAFKRVRKEFGPDAAICGTRTRKRRKRTGWGREAVVEVMVEARDTPDFPPAEKSDNPVDLAREVRQQVGRVERLVEEICQGGELGPTAEDQAGENPLHGHLVANGASAGAVTRLLTRFAGETGLALDDRPGALAWMTRHLSTGERPLNQWEGHHVFFAEHASDRLGPVLDLARGLSENGRRVLTVAVLPDPDRDETRLKSMAATVGHDAAVIRDPDQLPDLEKHLSGFDHVLLDLPALSDPRLDLEGRIHGWFAGHDQFHRHLAVPMDRDFHDLEYLRQSARDWNCDWLALTRMDRTRRSAKILDLIEAIPLPISFTFADEAGSEQVCGADSETILDKILATGAIPRFRPGLEVHQA